MPSGSCFCGNVRISYTGDPVTKVLCHCTDCRKISGSTYSTNIAVPEDTFTLDKGAPKSISKVADSGNVFTSHFCGDCGSTLWRDGPTFAGLKIIKVGVIDDLNALDEAKPVGELFVNRRVVWVPQVEGAEQK